MELLIISFLVAGLFVRNTTQDFIYKKLRGEDPPYLVRRRERAARRGVPLAERGAASRFFADAWEDAWEDAQEKRTRAHAKKREQRREGWAERDAIDALEDEAWKANEEHDRARADRDERRRKAWKSIPDHCEKCRRNIGKDDLTIATVNGDLLWVCRDCASPSSADGPLPDPVVHDDSPYVPGSGGADSEQPPPHLVDYAKNTKCRDCGGTVQVEKDPENPGQWIVRTTHTDENCAQNPDRPGGTVTPINAWRKPTASDNNTPEETDLSVNGETTNLNAALTYTSGMADSHDQAVASNEMSIAAMTSRGVTGETISLMTQAQELEQQLAGVYRQANAALSRHIQVQEAYHANQDAGDKQFVTQD